MKHLIIAIISLLSLPFVLHAEPLATFSEKPATRALLGELRSGGFVLYMRHGMTDNSKPDRVPQVDLNDCSTQRPLTEEGRKLAASVGKSVRKARIPIAEILSSPLCRARDSAKAAFGDKFQVVEKLMYTANMTSAEKKPNIEETRRLLSAPVARGGNRFIVSHAPNLADLIGYFPKEGTVVIFKPKGESGFEYIASIPPDLWSHLLKQ